MINYELPNVAEDYVHRIGRTGRAGRSGEAVSLVCNEERPFLKGIEKLTSLQIPLLDIEGFEPQDWPDRAPTASEVLKANARRKEAARQARPPRNRPQGSSKKKAAHNGSNGGGGGRGARRPRRRD